MPKKKKSGKKKEKKAKEVKIDSKAVMNAGPSSLEVSLRIELESLDREVYAAKLEVDEAREQHDYLLEELRRTEVEISEYEGFVVANTQREQTKLQVMADQNNEAIKTINRESADTSQEHAAIKAELQKNILQREGELEVLRRQISALGDVRLRRDEQLKEIAELEEEIKSTAALQQENLFQLKAKFMQEKIESQRQIHMAVTKLQSQANPLAAICLNGHAERIKDENRRLRKELLSIIKTNQNLQEREKMLYRQNKVFFLYYVHIP